MSSVPYSKVVTVLEVFCLSRYNLGDGRLDIFDIHLKTDPEDVVHDSIQILGVEVEEGGIHHMEGGEVFNGISDKECHLGSLTKCTWSTLAEISYASAVEIHIFAAM